MPVLTTGTIPRCPLCNAPMALRPAEQNSDRSWECPKSPNCQGQRKHVPPPPPPVKTTARVDWYDSTLRRIGWHTRYATIGASLRSLPSEQWKLLSNCWVSRETGSEGEPNPRTMLVVATMMKLLGRGSAPPMHPDAEQLLLERTGLGTQPAAGDDEDITPTLRMPTRLPDEGFVVPAGGDRGYDFDLTDSTAENDLVRLVNDFQPGAARWLLPQPSLDALLASGRSNGSANTRYDMDMGKGRRCDFLFVAPTGRPVIIEVDGGQHSEQKAVDTQRDRQLKTVGIDTIRIPTRQLSIGGGEGIDALRRLVTGAPTPSLSLEPLIWAPVQTHRLMLGLCEAVTGGFLTGDRWNVSVSDPTGLAVELIGPYLEMMDALDVMWGEQTVAPREATFRCGDRVVQWRRTAPAHYRKVPDTAHMGPAQATIILDAAGLPSEPMPEVGSNPNMVVVRSTTLPFPIRYFNWVDTRPEPFVDATQEHIAAAVNTLLRGVFAKPALREGQFEAIVEVLSGRDCVALLPTGAGKSLIYQFAGLCQPGRTLVIDPLVALIDDQMEMLREYGITRTVGIAHKKGDLADAADAYFVFVSPERLQRQPFRDELTEQAQVAPVNLVVVDEAHCVSEWGHDFRPSYLNFGKVLRDTCAGALGTPPLLALTGTASRAVLTDTMFQLGIGLVTENTVVRPISFDRPELSYRVVQTKPSDSAATLRGELQGLAGKFKVNPSVFPHPTGRSSDTYSGVVFVPTVNGYHGIERTVKQVRKVFPSVTYYSGGPPNKVPAWEWDSRKTRNAESFKENQATAIVTTKAFGMGIDKPNIRWVVHYGLPLSIEAYYQEVGRAGRDRRAAHCVLVFTEKDSARTQELLSDSNPVASQLNGSSKRDDIDQALWFHRQGFPPMETELRHLVEVFDMLNTGDTKIPLSSNTDSKKPDTDSKKRALHRLSILNTVTDYCLEGKYPNENAVVEYANPTADNIADGLLRFVERSQPGRLTSVREQLQLPYQSTRAALEECGSLLIGLVYDTIEKSRRRSLREMSLVASSAEGGDGETLRQRVLEYLTEGDIFPLVSELAERPVFVFEHWTETWAEIATENDLREWRAATARLLGSYPTHPGLLISRGLTEMLLPNGDIEEAERNLGQGLAYARKQYSVAETHLQNATRWLLGVLAGETDLPIGELVRNGTATPADLTASVVAAGQRTPCTKPIVDEWLARHWKSEPELALLKLFYDMERVKTLNSETLTKYAPSKETTI